MKSCGWPLPAHLLRAVGRRGCTSALSPKAEHVGSNLCQHRVVAFAGIGDGAIDGDAVIGIYFY